MNKSNKSTKKENGQSSIFQIYKVQVSVTSDSNYLIEYSYWYNLLFDRNWKRLNHKRISSSNPDHPQWEPDLNQEMRRIKLSIDKTNILKIIVKVGICKELMKI